jgi:hypothetical protein
VPSSTVLGAPPVDTVAPTITGAAVRGTLITSTPGTWSGVGTSIAYQWQRSSDGTTWTNIAAATGYTYTLGLADEGDEVRLLVTATNPDATVSAATTATTTVAASPPSATSSPMISGTAQRGLTLTSTAGGWDGLGNVITDQWQRSGDSGATWTAIAGATAPSYTLTVADEGDDVRLLVSATNPDGSVGQASAPSAPVTAAPPVETAPPTVTGIPQRTATLGSTLGTWTGVGDAYTFQWQRSADSGATWTNIAGATSATYAVGVGDETCELRLVVTAFNADATVSAASAATAAVPSAPPVNTTAPVITGTAQRGDTLIATTGTWGGIGDTTSQQWQRSSDSGVTWTAIPGATGTSYALTVADEGDEIRIVVTATNPDATVNAASAASAAVTASLPADSTAPTVAGTPQRGSALTLAPGTWTGNGVTFSDQWQRSGDGGTTWTAIAGATGTAYTPVVGDEGDQLRVLVTGTDPDGSATAPSAALATVTSSPPQVAIAPTLSGAAQRLSTLTATGGTWAGVGNTYADQWQRSPDGGATWTDIAGATASTYASAVADEGDTVRVVVTATNPDGTASAASAASGVVQSAPPVNTTPPAITGIPKLGAILSAGPGAWSPAGDTYDYTWQRGDPADGYQPIAGATGPTYALAAADVGESVEVTVTATNADGAVSATSPATATVTQPPHDTIAPTVPSGTPMQGSVLTADDGTWDSTVTFIDAWLRCPATATVVTPSCVHVGSGQTYTPGAQDVGSSLAVTVTASSPGGSSSATSPLTAIVAGQPLTDLTPPNISGNPQPPQVLSAGPGTWSVPLVTATYDWERCDPDGVSNCTQVAARASQYTLSAADDGHTIVLVANVTSPGRAATAQSAPLTVEDQPLPQVTVLPAITGTTTRTYALSATNGSWTNSPTAVTYQWQRCDATGHNCQNIAGATDTRYTLVAADEGFTITVTVTAANSTGSATAAATPTAAVAPLPPSVTRAPSLSAAAVQQGVAVSVAGAAWNATADTTYATSWERCDAGGGSCQVIAGATSAAYMPVGADVGHTLIAVITATNPDGSVPAATGASQVVLPASPRWHDLPVLSAAGGVVGTPLSITPGVWTGPVVTSDTTEVMRCTSTCVAVSSAGTYTILPADVGAILRLRETASNAGGTAVVWSAQYVGPVQSASAAAAVLLDGDAVLRNANGTALAVAQMSSGDAVAAHAVLAARGSRFGAGNGSAAGSGGAAGAGAARVITVRRARGVRGRLRAWACATTGGGAAGPPPCTRQLSLGSVGRLTLPDAMTGRVRVVVVRQRR